MSDTILHETSTDPFANSKEQVYPPHAIILDPGITPRDAWLIVEGTVRKYDIRPNGNEITLNIYKPGAVLALTWLLGGHSNTFFYESQAKLVVKKISADAYRKHLEAHPEQALDILKRVARGMEGIYTRLSANSLNDAEGRVLNEIRIEAARFGGVDAQGHKTLTMRTETLSSRTGLARETVSRMLTKLQTEQIIAKTGSKITIL